MKTEEIELKAEQISQLSFILEEKLKEYCENDGMAGHAYARNHNSSKKAILDLIKITRNELLVLAEKVKES